VAVFHPEVIMRALATSATPSRRRQGAALLACVHLALFVAWPAVHFALPGHEDGGHRCALCQSLQRGEGGAPVVAVTLAPANAREPAAATAPVPPTRASRINSPAIPRAPPSD
jgi:hypothetical protein